jgi:site-specific recombinase XerC
LLRCHVLPRFGHLRVDQIREDDVAALVAELTAHGLSGATVSCVLVPLGRVLDQPVRRGLISSNPVRGLERHERPKVCTVRCVCSHATRSGRCSTRPPYRTLLAAGVFTGLRIGELLGLTWADIDLQAGLVHVRTQIGQDGMRAPLKTPKARRSVVLMPTLGRLLREHRLRSPHSLEPDAVFSRPDGAALMQSTCRDQTRKAAVRAGLSRNPEQPRLRRTTCATRSPRF